MPLLSELVPGQIGRIDRIDLGDPLGHAPGGVRSDAVGQRLMEMGLLEGETVELVRFAPLGDPIEVRIGDYFLSLRKTEARRIQVTVPDR